MDTNINFVKLETSSNKDKKDLLEIAQKPEIMKFIGSGTVWSEQYIDSLKDSYVYYNWIIKDKEIVVGYIGLRPMNKEEGLQIRIFIYPGGKGYGSLALKELERRSKGIKLWSIVEVSNEPSNRLFKNWPLIKTEMVYGKQHNLYLLNQMKIQEVKKNIFWVNNNYIDVGKKSFNHFMHLSYTQFNVYKNILYEERALEKEMTYLFVGDSGLDKTPFYMDLKGWKNLASQREPYKKYDGVIDWIRVEQARNYDKCILKNKVEGHSFITDKSLLPLVMGDYMAKSTALFEPFPPNFKYPLIIKPVGNGAYSGQSIYIAPDETSLNEIKDLVKDIKKWKWIACEYIDDPLLFRTKKFHYRVYIMISSQLDPVLLPYYEILTAAKPYEKRNYANKEIHDSHGKSTPESFCVGLNVKYAPHMNKIKSTVNILFERIKGKFYPYSESQIGYELLGMDIMFDAQENIYILEINDKTGLGPMLGKVGGQLNEFIAKWECEYALSLLK